MTVVADFLGCGCVSLEELILDILEVRSALISRVNEDVDFSFRWLYVKKQLVFKG